MTSKTTKKIPCKECIVLALCRQKIYRKLITECEKIRSYLSINRLLSEVTDPNLHKERVRELSKEMNSPAWQIGEEFHRYYSIITITKGKQS